MPHKIHKQHATIEFISLQRMTSIVLYIYLTSFASSDMCQMSTDHRDKPIRENEAFTILNILNRQFIGEH